MAKREIDDRFKKFGTVSFTSISKVNDFVDNLEQGKVMATRCPECNISYFPPRVDCSKCLGSNNEWFDTSDKIGSLATFSKMKYGPVGFEDDLPYTIAVLDFGDFKMFGRIDNEVPEEEVKIGMKMKVHANNLQADQKNFVFKPA
jgi:uncharacterized OB-fold protein